MLQLNIETLRKRGVEVEQIAENITVFGRVSPEQKHTIIKTLKNKGHVVAMTGDGVNDTLALKEADCSIAMADGSEAARNIFIRQELIQRQKIKRLNFLPVGISL